MEHRNLPAATGGFWYLGCRLADSGASMLVDHVDLLRPATALARARWPFEIDAAVVLPAALHMIWRLPPGDDAVADRWRLIRTAFARQLVAQGLPSCCLRHLWDRASCRPVRIRDGTDLSLYRHLCNTAPMRAGLVRQGADWPWSSAHRRPRRADPPASVPWLPQVAPG